MEHTSFHGTNKTDALKIIGPPSQLNIDKGKGELGKGFYTGSSIALAAIWAQNRYKNNGVVIQFNIPAINFVKLRGHLIKTQSSVIENWNLLKIKNQTSEYTFGYDYIVAPFASIENTGYQYKFESKLSEEELKTCEKSIYLCGS